MCEQRREDVLKAAFKKADKDGSGELDIVELTKVLRACGSVATDSEIAESFARDDANCDKKICLSEFMAANNARDPKTVKIEELRELFRRYSGNDDTITCQDLKLALNGQRSAEECEQIIASADVDQSGTIEIEEFLKVWPH